VRVSSVVAVDFEIASDDVILNSGSQMKKKCKFIDEH